MPSLVPEPRRDADLHFVLCDFGRLGQAFMETDANSESCLLLGSGWVGSINPALDQGLEASGKSGSYCSDGRHVTPAADSADQRE